MSINKKQPEIENDFVYKFWNTFTGEKKMSHILPHFLNEFSDSIDKNKKKFAKIIIGEELIGKQLDSKKLLDFVNNEISTRKINFIRSNYNPTITKSDDNTSSNEYKIYDVDMLSGAEFEIFMKKLLDINGYTDTQITGQKGDQGGDILTYHNDEKIIIQAKNYSINRKVTNKAVQEVFGAIKYYNADKGLVVTNSFFTLSARELAKINNVILWDRRTIIELLKKYNSDEK